MFLGTITTVSCYTLRGAPFVAVAKAHFAADLGITGDLHADGLSPRQVLLASRSVYEDFALPPQALRENLLVDFDTAALRSGTVLQIGGAVRLRIMFQCEACGKLDQLRPGLARQVARRRGVLARVLAAGQVEAGDPISDLGPLAPAWPDDWRERVRRVLDAVPAGAVVEYRHLARLAGIQSSYCRAFPRLLGRLGTQYAARAVPAQSAVGLPRWMGESLFERF